MYGKIVLIVVLSALHIFFGIISFIVGVLTSAQSLIWMAHTVSPLWSGAFVSLFFHQVASAILEFDVFFLFTSSLSAGAQV